MRVTFVSNYINHHQIPLAEVLYQQWGDGYRFIQTEPMEEERVQQGWEVDLSAIPYLMYYKNAPEECDRLIEESDIVIFGGVEDESYIAPRLKAGKIVLRYMERLYREGQWKAISPRGLRKKYIDHTQYSKAPVYLLCAGGYVAHDFEIIRAYRGKRFKWGYFTAFEESTPEMRQEWKKGEELRLLWAGRFIDCKRAMDAMVLAKNLKDKGYRFTLTVAGGGNGEAALKEYVSRNGLEECVQFIGFCKPAQVRELMKAAHIYLFTSDYREGWGAVVNESMNSACAVVASHAVGAVPFLLQHEENGLIYKSGDIKDLTYQVERLCNDAKLRNKLGEAAYMTIATEWNPQNAGAALVSLCEDLVKGDFTFRKEGPLSEAKVIKQRKMYKFLCEKRP